MLLSFPYAINVFCAKLIHESNENINRKPIEKFSLHCSKSILLKTEKYNHLHLPTIMHLLKKIEFEFFKQHYKPRIDKMALTGSQELPPLVFSKLNKNTEIL